MDETRTPLKGSLAANLDDFLARATRAHWSPLMLLEQLAQAAPFCAEFWVGVIARFSIERQK